MKNEFCYLRLPLLPDGTASVLAAVFTIITLILLSHTQVQARPLNDTGITWGGDYPSGNNTTCTSNISSPQDCHQGRDAAAAAGTLTKEGAGHGGFDFTKLDTDGNPLPASAVNWSCVRDNHTNLVWEVKTDDGSIHDKDNSYRWGGKTRLGTGYGTYYDDWNSLVDGNNSESFCGFSDWRVPTIKELENLASLGRKNVGRSVLDEKQNRESE